MNKFVLGAFCLLMIASCSTFRKSDSAQPEKYSLLSDMAAAALAEGDATSALIYLEEAQSLEPDSPRIHYLFALAYHKKKNLDLAIASARKSVALSSEFSSAKNTLGRLLFEKGEWNEAEKFLKESAEDLKFSDAYIARINLGILYYQQGKTEQAKTQLTHAIEENPQLACVAGLYRGQIYLREGKLKQAKKDFELASRSLCIAMTESRLWLGKTLIQMKDYPLARTQLLELKKQFPEAKESEEAVTLLKEIP